MSFSERSQETEVTQPGLPFDTDYYSIAIPYTWVESCSYDLYESEYDYGYALSFYNAARDWYFGITLVSTSSQFPYSDPFGIVEKIGSMEVYRIDDFDVYALYLSQDDYEELGNYYIGGSYEGYLDELAEVVGTITVPDGVGIFTLGL